MIHSLLPVTHCYSFYHIKCDISLWLINADYETHAWGLFIVRKVYLISMSGKGGHQRKSNDLTIIILLFPPIIMSIIITLISHYCHCYKWKKIRPSKPDTHFHWSGLLPLLLAQVPEHLAHTLCLINSNVLLSDLRSTTGFKWIDWQLRKWTVQQAPQPKKWQSTHVIQGCLGTLLKCCLCFSNKYSAT